MKKRPFARFHGQGHRRADQCSGCDAADCSHMWPHKKCCPDCSHGRPSDLELAFVSAELCRLAHERRRAERARQLEQARELLATRSWCASELGPAMGLPVQKAKHLLDRLEARGVAESEWQPSPGSGLGRRHYSLVQKNLTTRRRQKTVASGARS